MNLIKKENKKCKDFSIISFKAFFVVKIDLKDIKHRKIV